MEEYDLLQCIDKALDSFGSSVKNAIFWKMTMHHNSSRSEVLSDPDILSCVIQETFAGSAKGIEMAIITELKRKFTISSRGVQSLVGAINDAKTQIISTLAPGSFVMAPTQRLRPNILA